MNEEPKKEEEQRDAGLTTAALADAGERTALKTELEVLPPATELLAKVPAVGASTLGDHSIAPAGTATTVAKDAQATPLFSPDEAKAFRVRWDTIQGGFVDEPRHAVEQADSLVAGAMKRLAEIFAEERAKLEGQWDRQESVSTEDLRLALRRYRSFFGRVLSV
jgi:hypothetical protein